MTLEKHGLLKQVLTHARPGQPPTAAWLAEQGVSAQPELFLSCRALPYRRQDSAHLARLPAQSCPSPRYRTFRTKPVPPAHSEVKAEVNPVGRGSLLPVLPAGLCASAADEFKRTLRLPILAPAELYGSKLLAAMDRQHPARLVRLPAAAAK